MGILLLSAHAMDVSRVTPSLTYISTSNTIMYTLSSGNDGNPYWHTWLMHICITVLSGHSTYYYA